MEKTEFTSTGQPPLDQQFTKGRFENRIAVVSGGGSGIGYAVAERFANDGATVVILEVDRSKCELAERRFTEQGWKKCVTCCVDVTNKNEVISNIAKICGEVGGKIDYLVTSAAYFGSQGINSSPDDWHKSLEVNVVGVSNVVQSCIPFMSGVEGAAIVTISSISAIRAQKDRWTYSATKGAIKTITKNMALDLSSNGIRVNSVSPGWIWSPEASKASRDGTMKTLDDDFVHKFKMLRRSGYTSEVAGAVTFLCSKDASYITGTNLMVDGGYSAMGPERHGDESAFAGHEERK